MKSPFGDKAKSPDPAKPASPAKTAEPPKEPAKSPAPAKSPEPAKPPAEQKPAAAKPEPKPADNKPAAAPAPEKPKQQQPVSSIMTELSEDTMDEIQERFDIFDKKGDKKIESKQIIDVLRSLGMNPITSDVAKLIKDSDIESKRIDQDEFCPIFQQLAQQPIIATVEDMIECMKTMDKHNAGNISSAALRTLLCNLGDTLTEAQADVMLANYEDENGMVSYPNMVKALVSAS